MTDTADRETEAAALERRFGWWGMWAGPQDDPREAGGPYRGEREAPGNGDWWTRVRRHSLGWVCARCEGLHVDFEDHSRGFYRDACGFKSTGAGLIAFQA